MAMSEPENIVVEAAGAISNGIKALGGWIAIILLGTTGSFYMVAGGMGVLAICNFLLFLFFTRNRKQKRRKR